MNYVVLVNVIYRHEQLLDYRSSIFLTEIFIPLSLHLLEKLSTSQGLLNDIEPLIIFKPLNDFYNIRMIQTFMEHDLIQHPLLQR